MQAAEDSLEHRRLVTKAAWLYHERRLRQTEIASRLGVSQSRVSRLLDSATALGIVRTVVVPPDGLFGDLEARLEEAYGLEEVRVFDVGTTDDTELTVHLGRALATVLQSRPLQAEVIGLTSWSRSLREMIAHLGPLPTAAVSYVVEMLGDVGPPQLQHAAAQATEQLADITGATPMFLRVAGVAPTVEARRALVERDRHAQRALAMLDSVDMALVGVGTPEIVPPLAPGDNYFTEEQFALAKQRGAVGQVDLHFLDQEGGLVETPLDSLLVGITVEQLRAARSRLGVAGGTSKYAAIRATLLGGWLTTLVTDTETATWLLENRRPIAKKRTRSAAGGAA